MIQILDTVEIFNSFKNEISRVLIHGRNFSFFNFICVKFQKRFFEIFKLTVDCIQDNSFSSIQSLSRKYFLKLNNFFKILRFCRDKIIFL